MWHNEVFDGTEDDFEVGTITVGWVSRVLATTQHGGGVLLRDEPQRREVRGQLLVGAVTERLGVLTEKRV